jgi:G3E family GTPase
MSHGERIPLSAASEPGPATRPGTILILTDNSEPPPGYAAIRHAEAAAVAQHGGCACCRVPSDLVTLLRQLFLERVRGETIFDAVMIEGSPQLAEAALTDPLVAARYELKALTRRY